MSKSFRSIAEGRVQAFVLELENGKATLYQYRDETPIFLLTTETIPVVTLVREGEINYQQQLSVFLTGCNLYTQIQRTTYSKEDLVDLMKEYNACEMGFTELENRVGVADGSWILQFRLGATHAFYNYPKEGGNFFYDTHAQFDEVPIRIGGGVEVSTPTKALGKLGVRLAAQAGYSSFVLQGQGTEILGNIFQYNYTYRVTQHVAYLGAMGHLQVPIGNAARWKVGAGFMGAPSLLVQEGTRTIGQVGSASTNTSFWVPFNTTRNALFIPRLETSVYVGPIALGVSGCTILGGLDQRSSQFMSFYFGSLWLAYQFRI